MGARKETELGEEKRRILYIYLAIVTLTMLSTAVALALVGLNLLVLAPSAIFLAILTVMFLISYTHTAEWGWMMFGRRRVFSGSPWQSRVSADLAHMDARRAVEQQDEYDRAREYERPEAMANLLETREALRESRKSEMPKPSGESRLGEGVLECPQCGTPYVHDEDNPFCVRCRTRLHGRPADPPHR